MYKCSAADEDGLVLTFGPVSLETTKQWDSVTVDITISTVAVLPDQSTEVRLVAVPFRAPVRPLPVNFPILPSLPQALSLTCATDAVVNGMVTLRCETEGHTLAPQTLFTVAIAGREDEGGEEVQDGGRHLAGASPSSSAKAKAVSKSPTRSKAKGVSASTSPTKSKSKSPSHSKSKSVSVGATPTATPSISTSASPSSTDSPAAANASPSLSAGPDTSSSSPMPSPSPAAANIVTAKGAGMSNGDIVGLAVGCAVAGLIVIAVVVWLASKRGGKAKAQDTRPSPSQPHTPASHPPAVKRSAQAFDGDVHLPVSPLRRPRQQQRSDSTDSDGYPQSPMQRAMPVRASEQQGSPMYGYPTPAQAYGMQMQGTPMSPGLPMGGMVPQTVQTHYHFPSPPAPAPTPAPAAAPAPAPAPAPVAPPAPAPAPAVPAPAPATPAKRAKQSVESRNEDLLLDLLEGHASDARARDDDTEVQAGRRGASTRSAMFDDFVQRLKKKQRLAALLRSGRLGKSVEGRERSRSRARRESDSAPHRSRSREAEDRRRRRSSPGKGGRNGTESDAHLHSADERERVCRRACDCVCVACVCVCGYLTSSY